MLIVVISCFIKNSVTAMPTGVCKCTGGPSLSIGGSNGINLQAVCASVVANCGNNFRLVDVAVAKCCCACNA